MVGLGGGVHVCVCVLIVSHDVPRRASACRGRSGGPRPGASSNSAAAPPRRPRPRPCPSPRRCTCCPSGSWVRVDRPAGGLENEGTHITHTHTPINQHYHAPRVGHVPLLHLLHGRGDIVLHLGGAEHLGVHPFHGGEARLVPQLVEIETLKVGVVPLAPPPRPEPAAAAAAAARPWGGRGGV